MKKTERSLDMQRLAEELLSLPLSGDDELRRELEARGVMPNGAGALLYAQWKRAVEGDLKAASFLRELLAEPKKGAAGPAGGLRALSDGELLAMLAADGDGGAV